MAHGQGGKWLRASLQATCIRVVASVKEGTIATISILKAHLSDRANAIWCRADVCIEFTTKVLVTLGCAF